MSGSLPFEPVFLLTLRSIAGYIPDCAIEEHHMDRSTVTKHPVEKGAEISDHMYSEPPSVHLRWAWSEAFKGEGFAALQYEQILQLKNSRTVLTIMTGKRIYPHMVIETIEETTDRTSEYALFLEIGRCQVNIVQTQAANVPPSSVQANPEQTGDVQEKGRQTPIEEGGLPLEGSTIPGVG
jgi:hypothetical protein